jgi:hypothetical protein
MKTALRSSDPEINRWRDLYRIGGVATLLVALLVVTAIGAYFVWPYSGSETGTQEILSGLAENPLGSLISLDLIMLITLMVYLLTVLSLYAALRTVNESYAFIALVLGIVSVATVITSRPLFEMVALSEKFAEAGDETERAAIRYSGETIRLLFDGTAWFMQTILLILSGLISSTLMLKSSAFGNGTARLGIAASVAGLLFWIPGIGIGFLFLNTILTVPWCILVGSSLLRLAGR